VPNRPAPTNNDDWLQALGARMRQTELDAVVEPDAAGASAVAFSDAAAERIAARILAQSAAASSTAQATTPESTAAAAGPETAQFQRSASNVVPISSARNARSDLRTQPRRATRLLWALVPMAAAAALLLTINRRTDPLLPAYELAVVAANSHRADPAPNNGTSSAKLDADGDFEWLARPATPAHDVVAHAVLLRDGKAAPWQVRTEISVDGAVRLNGTCKQLFPDTTTGAHYTIVVILATRSALPSMDQATTIASRTAPAPAAVRVLRANVHF
jgi:hypothetical protein